VSQSTRREGRNAGALACPTSRLGWRAEGYHPRDFPNTNRTTSHPFSVESIYGNGRTSATSITRRHMRPSRFVLQYLSHLISSACTSCSTVHSYAAQAASLYRYSVPGTCFSSFLRISSHRLCTFSFFIRVALSSNNLPGKITMSAASSKPRSSRKKEYYSESLRLLGDVPSPQRTNHQIRC
jgi:K+-sensing histidine kinase KdpD